MLVHALPLYDTIRYDAGPYIRSDSDVLDLSCQMGGQSTRHFFLHAIKEACHGLATRDLVLGFQQLRQLAEGIRFDDGD